MADFAPGAQPTRNNLTAFTVQQIWLDRRAGRRSIAVTLSSRTWRGRLCENMASSRKPEVHNVSQRLRRRTGLRPQSRTT